MAAQHKGNHPTPLAPEPHCRLQHMYKRSIYLPETSPCKERAVWGGISKDAGAESSGGGGAISVGESRLSDV